jgi:hypothetical protein
VRRQLASQQVNAYYDLYLNAETARYLLRAIAIKEIVEKPEQYGFHIAPEHLYPPVATVRVIVASDIPEIAKWSLDNGCNYKIVKLLNPWLRKPGLHVKPGKQYEILLPRDRILKTDLAARVKGDSILLTDTHYAPAAAAPEYEVYLVKRGDTFSSVAKKFEVTVAEVLQWNDLSQHSVLKPGMKIRIQKP